MGSTEQQSMTVAEQTEQSHELSLLVCDIQDLHERAQGLHSIPADRQRQLLRIGRGLGPRLYEAIQDQYCAVHQLGKSLGRIQKDVLKAYERLCDGLDYDPAICGLDHERFVRDAMARGMREADQLVARFDNEIDRLWAARRRELALLSQGQWEYDSSNGI